MTDDGGRDLQLERVLRGWLDDVGAHGPRRRVRRLRVHRHGGVGGLPRQPAAGREDLRALAADVAPLLDRAERVALEARLARASEATGQDSLDRSVNEFHGNDFRGMDLVDVAFRRGIDLTKQVLPEDDDYVLVADARTAVERACDAVRLWEDDRACELGLARLGHRIRDVEEGQRHVLLRASEWRTDGVRRELFRLLTPARRDEDGPTDRNA